MNYEDQMAIFENAAAEVALWEPWKRNPPNHKVSVSKRALINKVCYKLDLFASCLDEQLEDKKDQEIVTLARRLRLLAAQTRSLE